MDNKQNKTVSDKIWEEIKGKSIEMFSLPNQIVENYCKQVNIEPSKLYLVLTASAALPALEIAIGQRYAVETADKFVVVSYSEPKLK